MSKDDPNMMCNKYCIDLKKFFIVMFSMNHITANEKIHISQLIGMNNMIRVTKTKDRSVLWILCFKLDLVSFFTYNIYFKNDLALDMAWNIWDIPNCSMAIYLSNSVAFDSYK